MKQLYKKIVSLLLLTIMIVTMPLQVLAEMPSNSGASNIPICRPGGGGYNPTAPIFRDYGFRVTFGTSEPMDGSIDSLTGA